MKRFVQVVLSIVVGGALIWLLFHDTDWKALKESIASVAIGWLLLSQVPILLSFVTRIQRWRYIVRAAAPARFWGMFSSTQVGILVNFVAPMRLGELVRALALSRLEGIPLSKSLALAGLDRVTDIIGLVAIMLVAVAAFPRESNIVIPKETFAGMTTDYHVTSALINTGSLSIGIGLVVLIATLGTLYFQQAAMFRVHKAFFQVLVRVLSGVSARLGRWVEILAAKLRHVLEQFAEGLHVFRSPSDMAKSAFFSLLTWGFFLMSTQCCLWAFHLDTPWYAAFVIQSMVAVSISVSVSPGFIGQFHLAIIVGVLLSLPSIGVADAKALAIVVHILNLFPIAVVGLICLVIDRARLFDIAREGAAGKS